MPLSTEFICTMIASSQASDGAAQCGRSGLPCADVTANAYAYAYMRFNLNDKQLPVYYHYSNVPFEVKYKKAIILVSIALFLLLALIAYYILHLFHLEVQRRKNAQKKLAEDEQFLLMSLKAGTTFAYSAVGDMKKDAAAVRSRTVHTAHIRQVLDCTRLQQRNP